MAQAGNIATKPPHGGLKQLPRHIIRISVIRPACASIQFRVRHTAVYPHHGKSNIHNYSPLPNFLHH